MKTITYLFLTICQINFLSVYAQSSAEKLALSENLLGEMLTKLDEPTGSILEYPNLFKNKFLGKITVDYIPLKGSSYHRYSINIEREINCAIRHLRLESAFDPYLNASSWVNWESGQLSYTYEPDIIKGNSSKFIIKFNDNGNIIARFHQDYNGPGMWKDNEIVGEQYTNFDRCGNPLHIIPNWSAVLSPYDVFLTYLGNSCLKSKAISSRLSNGEVFNTQESWNYNTSLKPITYKNEYSKGSIMQCSAKEYSYDLNRRIDTVRLFICSDRKIKTNIIYYWNSDQSVEKIKFIPGYNPVDTFLYTFSYLNCVTTSTNNQVVNQIKIFPNPAHEVFHIDLDESIATEQVSLEIRNVNGALLQKRNLVNDKEPIVVGHLNPGSYFLKITSKDLSYNYLLIKQ
jgi:hypothetical protein